MNEQQPVTTSKTAPARQRWLAAGTIAGLFVLWFYVFDNTYPFRITVDLEIDGKPIALTRVINCVERTASMGLGSKTEHFFVPEIASFGQKLSDGSAVLIRTPRVCELRQKDEKGDLTWQPIHPEHLPLIGWTPNADNPETIEMYLSRRALIEPGRRVKFRSISVTQPKWTERVSKFDQFSWFRLPSKVKFGVRVKTLTTPPLPPS